MWAYFKKLIVNLTADFSSTQTLIGKAIVGLLTFYAPVQLYVIGIAFFVIVDLITGIWAARVKGIPFSSRMFRKGLLEKYALYGMLFTGTMVLGKIFQSVLHYQTFYLAWFFTILVIVYELSSIIENVVAIKPELAFLNKIKDMLSRVQEKQLDEIEKKLSVFKEDKKEGKG